MKQLVDDCLTWECWIIILRIKVFFVKFSLFLKAYNVFEETNCQTVIDSKAMKNIYICHIGPD